MADLKFFTVTESFIGNLDGIEVEYQKGEVVGADDPAVKKMPSHFEPIVVKGGAVRGGVEQATAAPGEKRSYVRKSKPEPEQPAGKALTTASLKGK